MGTKGGRYSGDYAASQYPSHFVAYRCEVSCIPDEHLNLLRRLRGSRGGDLLPGRRVETPYIVQQCHADTNRTVLSHSQGQK